MKNLKELFEIRKKLKKDKKLVHSIVSKIGVFEICNFTLATGARIICADAIEEVEEVTKNADSLTISLANINKTRFESQKSALESAKQNNKPVSLDIVGVGISDFRRNILNELFKIKIPEVIKGNFTEIESLYKGYKTIGIDELENDSNDIFYKKSVVKELSKKLNSVVLATGEVDIISNGEDVVTISNGNDFMPQIVATGCILNSIIGAYLTELDPLNAAIISVLLFDISGEISKGSSPIERFIDMQGVFYNLDYETVKDKMRLEYEKI
ncbi:hydroxyethylthiazole kinase [uncultured Peptoniphilus sp.]|uniref:hydroxyethylthiazole kinase n=1 Tax=uncultured Peptoniphilus sp. TaxID=254354 RepID=UPI002803FA86|nr:hydroxyethylthiazole kinase [uncultured Peptoniphilus sp.]